MPAYDYRCTQCERELEIVHRISETITHQAHTDPKTDEACDGPLERLISPVGYAHSVGNKAPSDSKLQGLGFTKYVKSDRGGYEKAFGPDSTPTTIQKD